MIARHLLAFTRRAAGYLRLRRDAAELARSGLFDAAWYRARNTDLGPIANPALHYLRRGADEGRQPSAAFNGDAYRVRYPDVDMSDANPLLHYLRIGRAERRDIFSGDENIQASQGPLARQPMCWKEVGQPKSWPLISIIIPSRERPAMLARVVADMRERTDYPHIEIIVVDNASRSFRARRLLARFRQQGQIRVLDYLAPFNWSAMNNAAARIARGDIFLLLNNDIRARQPGWLKEMVALALRPEIGVTGAKLLYPNGRVQHAGISLGRGAVARHLCRHASADDPGPDGILARRRAAAAVTGACMAIRRDVFHAVGGLEEAHLGVTNGDTDLCLRLRARGFYVAWTPFAVLHHHEAATRGLDVTDAHRARLRREREYLLRSWGVLAQTDPYLPPGMVLAGERLVARHNLG